MKILIFEFYKLPEKKLQMRNLWLMLFMCMMVSWVHAQDMSAETRKRFIQDQDAYLNSLNLNLDQRRDYQTITIQYEKRNMAAQSAGLNTSALKSRLKRIRKAKDAEMKRILNQYQFKLYKKRQKEIDTNYE